MMFNFVSTWLWHKALSIISGCVCKGVSGETSIWVAKLSEADYPLSMGEPSFNLLRVWIEQKRRGRRNSFSARLLTYDFNLLSHSRLTPLLSEIYHWFSWVFSLQATSHETSQPPQMYESSPYNKMYAYIYYWFYFSEELWTNLLIMILLSNITSSTKVDINLHCQLV